VPRPESDRAWRPTGIPERRLVHSERRSPVRFLDSAAVVAIVLVEAAWVWGIFHSFLWVWSQLG
jgi:hypothetical protein